MTSLRRALAVAVLAIIGTSWSAAAAAAAGAPGPTTATPGAVVNGNFGAGNTGFTSQYAVSANLGPPGTYAIGADPRLLNGFWPIMRPHRPATEMFIANGSTTADQVAWSETVAVAPNSTYVFSVWVASLYRGPPVFRLAVNGGLLGTRTAPSAVGKWERVSFSWRSGSSRTAVLSIVDDNLAFGGNDFALDSVALTGPPSGGASVNQRVSSIGSSLPTPSRAFSPVSSDVVNAVITVCAVLFITFPAKLFNSTFQENYEDISAWWAKWLGFVFPVRLRGIVKRAWRATKRQVLKALGLAGRSAEKKLERDWARFGAVLLVGALLGALLDPSFGPNLRTVISYVAVVMAMAAGVALSGLVTGSYHRARHHGKIPYKLEALPSGLFIAAACVVISRGTGFTPGYLYGVICGVVFGRELAKHEQGHLVALGSIVNVSLGLVAWLAWDGVQHYAAKSGSFIGAVLIDDLLASFFVASLVGTVISLFPLKFMPGHQLQSWHKGVWAATFIVSLFVLVQVLLRPHGAGGPSHVPLVTTLVLLALFGGGSLLFRDHFEKKRRRQGTVAVAPIGEEPAAAGAETPQVS